ncbi:MAG: thiamine permease [Acidimicrobiaceae bacterium]|nr:thiamine permease [Acidimicrobiaceae bacterium]
MKEVLSIPMAEAGPVGIERRGIDFVPEAERWARPVNLFWMWAGAIFNVEYLVYGAVLMSFGFSFAQAVFLILVGNLSWILLGLTSLQGPLAGTTTFTINRASFGPNGSKLLAFFNWLTQVGFETEGIALIVLAGLALTTKAGIHSSTALKVAFIVAASLIQLVLPLFGHETILKTLRVLLFPFLALFVVFAFLSLSKVNLHSVHHGANWQTMLEGLAFVITTSGLGWTENGNDYSRYLPKKSSAKATVGWVFLGTFVPSVLLMGLGAAVATFAGSNSGSITGMSAAFSSWFLWPYLIVSIIQLFAINSLDLYSSGMTLQALGLKLTRLQAVFVDTVICGLFAAYAIFANSFNTLLQEFILFIVVWVAPWTAIYLVDWLLRKKRYQEQELQRTDGGIYYRNGGVHWPAIIAQILGMFASLMALDAYPHFVSPVSNATNGADFSVFTGLLVGGVAYLILAGKGVKSEAELHTD